MRSPQMMRPSRAGSRDELADDGPRQGAVATAMPAAMSRMQESPRIVGAAQSRALRRRWTGSPPLSPGNEPWATGLFPKMVARPGSEVNDRELCARRGSVLYPHFPGSTLTDAGPDVADCSSAHPKTPQRGWRVKVSTDSDTKRLPGTPVRGYL